MKKLFIAICILLSACSSSKNIDHIEITTHIRDCEDKRIENIRYTKAPIEYGLAIWNEKHYGVKELKRILRKQGYTYRVVMKPK